MTRVAQLKKSALALPPRQRLRLVQDIWDSIAEESASVPVPRDHLRLIAQREAAHQRDPSRIKPWPQVKRDMQRRLAQNRARAKSA